MTTARTFRAMGNDLRAFGFWPSDLVALGLAFVLIHGFGNSLLLDLVLWSPMAWASYKTRRRAPRFLRGLYTFLITPQRLQVGLGRERFRP